MDTKFIKSALEKKKNQQADQHVSPIAGTIFGITLVIGILGAVFGGVLGAAFVAVGFAAVVAAAASVPSCSL